MYVKNQIKKYIIFIILFVERKMNILFCPFFFRLICARIAEKCRQVAYRRIRSGQAIK